MATQEHDDRPSGPPGANEVSKGSLLAAVATFLLVLAVGIVILILVAAGVVYITATTARRLGLPEVPLLATFLALACMLVVGYSGSRIASALEDLQAHLHRASSRISDAIDYWADTDDIDDD